MTTAWMAHFAVDVPHELDPTHLEAFLDAFPEDAGAAVAGSPNASATFTVIADDVDRAFGEAHRVFRKALAASGLSVYSDARGEVVRADVADAELEQPTVPELLGLTEVAVALGVSKQRVGQLREREDFPKPLVTLAAGPVWSKVSLGNFIDGWSRLGGRPPGAGIARFELKQARNGQFVFNLKAGNGQIIATSEMYTTKDAALRGIESVRKLAVADETVIEVP